QMADQVYEVVRIFGNSDDSQDVLVCEYLYGGSEEVEQRRMQVDSWTYNNGVYHEVSVGVENFDKNLAHIWKKDDATNIWMSGHFEVQFLDSYQGWVDIGDDVDEYGFHESEIEIIIISRYFDGNSSAMSHGMGRICYLKL